MSSGQEIDQVNSTAAFYSCLGLQRGRWTWLNKHNVYSSRHRPVRDGLRTLVPEIRGPRCRCNVALGTASEGFPVRRRLAPAAAVWSCRTLAGLDSQLGATASLSTNNHSSMRSRLYSLKCCITLTLPVRCTNHCQQYSYKFQIKPPEKQLHKYCNCFLNRI